MGESESFTFVCPECGEAIDVNRSMRDALISHGCVICGAGITAEHFS